MAVSGTIICLPDWYLKRNKSKQLKSKYLWEILAFFLQIRYNYDVYALGIHVDIKGVRIAIPDYLPTDTAEVETYFAGKKARFVYITKKRAKESIFLTA